MKRGDLVKVVFPYGEETVGIFMGLTKWDDEELITSRADVFWDGEIYSTALDQIEVISESR